MVDIEESVRSRELRGPLAWAAKSALMAIPITGIFFLMNVPQMLGWLFFNEQYMGLFLGLALFATFLLVPHKRGASQERVPWFDLLFALGGLVVGCYILI